jgi:7-cyano-7-deazaguanine synthase
MTKAVLLLSGGLDTATCFAWAKEQGFSVYALTFDYGQRNRYELVCADKLCAHFGAVQHECITLPNLTMRRSALTDHDLAVPQYEAERVGVPITYVPARNTLFLSFALGWAEVLGAHDLIIGCSHIDYSGYPDCRPAYIEAYERMANLATAMALEHPITLHTPLMHLSKKETIELGVALGVDYGLTSSCYQPSAAGVPCGTCDSCALRAQGFKEAGMIDPASRHCKQVHAQ